MVFLNAACQHLYVAIGDPGIVEAIDTHSLAKVQIVSTEAGAHTTGFDPVRSQLYVFCPQSHPAAVYENTAP